MSKENPLDPSDAEFELALFRLCPSAIPDDRASIAFEAGRRAGRRSLRLWQTAASSLAISLALLMFPRFSSSPGKPGEGRGEGSAQLVQLPTLQPLPNSYLALQNQVLSTGLSALPSDPPSSREEPTRAFVVRTYTPKFPTLFGDRS